MDWIKANYEKFLLALAALLLLALSAVLIFQARGFSEVFQSVVTEPPRNNKIEPVDDKEIERAQGEIQTPDQWADAGHGSLFVSEKYLIRDDKPYNPYKGGEDMYPPIKNQWFADNHLNLLDPGVLSQDPDGDGFNNKEEWTAQTNPQDKTSHPPYTTKLRLKEWIHVRFQFVFKSYDGDPAKLDAMEFQINPLGGKGSSQFLKKGEKIAGTSYTITGFEQKKFTDANGIERDVSELKIEDTAAKKKVTMVMGKQVESPNSLVVFKYLIDNTEFRVQIDQTFSLQPESDKKYKLLDTTPTEATIQDEDTKKPIKVPHL